MLLASGVSAAALSRGAALAQTAAPPAPAGQTPTVQEVVVTANRSGAESLQKVSMAISAVSEADIERAHLGDITDLTQFTPSLSIDQGAPGFNKFDMRGLTTGAYRTSDTSDRSLVAVYLDDTPISVQGQTPDLKVYDLDRVEILRGPQGTLYGAGSMAGTIRFVTAKPDSQRAFGTFEVDGYDTEHGAGSGSGRLMFNDPLIKDVLAVRGTFYAADDGGYINNIGDLNKKDANRDTTTQGRLAFRFTPNDKLTVDASYTFEVSHAYGLNNAFTGLSPYTISTNSPEGDSDDFNLLALSWDYDAGFADVISTTSYTWRRIGFHLSDEPTIGYFFQNYTGLPLGSVLGYPVFNQPSSYNQQVTDKIPAEYYTIDNKVQDLMEEFRLVSKNDGPVKWNVGVFYEQQTRDLYQDIPVPGFDTLSYENYFYGPFSTPTGAYNSKTVDAAFEPNDIFSGLQNETEHQIAVFTDDTWHATSKLDLTAGVRYFNFNEKYYLFEGGVYGVINHVPLTENAKLSSNGFNPRFNVTYHVNDNLMLYAEAAKGFRYGGANQPVPLGTTGVAGQCTQNLASYGLTSAPLTFGPDSLWSYSGGEKARLFDGRMTLNADVYWINWKNPQTRLLLNCSYFFTENQGDIISRGVEAETTIRLTNELTLNANGSYDNAYANGDIPTVGAYSGDKVPYFPTWIASVALAYDKSIGDGRLHAQIGYQYRGSEQTTFNPIATTVVGGQLTNAPNPEGPPGAILPSPTFGVIPASNNVNASAAYDIGRYEFGVFGDNLIDGVKETDITRATYYAIYQAGNRITVARPRTVGARVKVKF